MSRLTFNEPSHTYWLESAENGKRSRVPSVSSLKNTLFQFAGERWYISQSAEALQSSWDSIAESAPPMRGERLERAAGERIAYARDFGRAVHHYCEQLWTGEPQEVPEEYAPHVKAVADWWDATGVRLYAAESMCFADPVEDMGIGPMAGRFDLLVEHPRRGLGLLDLKTWTARSAGTARVQEWAFQLAAYAGMEFLVVDEEDREFPQVNWAAVLHVGPGGLRQYELPGDQWANADNQVEAARILKALRSAKMTEVSS